MDSPITKFLNPVEFKAFVHFTHYIPCDAMVSVLFIHPGGVEKSSNWHVTVELNGKETRGQLVLDHLKESPDNARIVERICEEDMKTIMLWVCGDPSANVEIV